MRKGQKVNGNTIYTQRKVVLNEKSVQKPESEDSKPSNTFKPLKPFYNIHSTRNGQYRIRSQGYL